MLPMLTLGMPGFPLGPFVLGVILAPSAELNLREGLTGSYGSFMPLLTRPDR